jgi:hypothetical protein
MSFLLTLFGLKETNRVKLKYDPDSMLVHTNMLSGALYGPVFITLFVTLFHTGYTSIYTVVHTILF